MEEADVKNRLEWALSTLWQKDKYLLENDSSERGIAARLAMYLQEHFIEYEYDVDAEYNRQQGDPPEKRLRLLPKECQKRLDRKEDKIVVPDVIVHVRECSSQNLLVIEMKKSSNQAGMERDRQRIEAFCEQLHYRCGALVECVTKTPAIRADWYSCHKWTDGFINLS